MPTSTAIRRLCFLDGVTPAGKRGFRAHCHCGYATTPRVSADRAVAALDAEHGHSTYRCQLCERNRDLRDLDVFTDEAVGEFFACRTDETVCHDLANAIQRTVTMRAFVALGIPGPRVVRRVPLTSRGLTACVIRCRRTPQGQPMPISATHRWCPWCGGPLEPYYVEVTATDERGVCTWVEEAR